VGLGTPAWGLEFDLFLASTSFLLEVLLGGFLAGLDLDSGGQGRDPGRSVPSFDGLDDALDTLPVRILEA
jgi:hypothetical protein